MAKKAKKSAKANWVKRFFYLIKSHKLITFLTALVLLFPASFSYEKYNDWDNAQMIKGLARDFPELVKQLEAATGLDLEITTNCMTTTEKFSNGVKTCELSVGYIGIESVEDIINPTLNVSSGFKQTGEINNTNRNYSYRKKDSCDLWFADEDRFNFRCITDVNEGNIKLAKEQFGSIK